MSVIRLLQSLVAGLVLMSACAQEPSDRRPVPDYDTFTGRLVRLGADQNGDGRLDQWTYLEGNRPLRGEADVDGDGRIDRWEYFNADAALVAIGTSSLGDGIEDTWTQVALTAAGEAHVARSRHRDRQLDRHEYFKDNVLVRAEEDTNADGRIDRWDRYEGSVMREVLLDTTFGTGKADRRLLYDAQGRFTLAEAVRQ